MTKKGDGDEYLKLSFVFSQFLVEPAQFASSLLK